MYELILLVRNVSKLLIVNVTEHCVERFGDRLEQLKLLLWVLLG